MRNLLSGRCKNKIICVIICAAAVMSVPQTAWAQEIPMPHLIQTVNDQDIYNGLTALGLLECETLDEEDMSRAYEMVRDCVVRVNMGNAYGSGVIWQFTQDAVIIATNEHVLAYWEDADGFVYFPDGYYVDARILGISEVYDVGFLTVDREQFTWEELMALRHVSVDEQVYEKLSAGEEMFCLGAGAQIGEVEYHEGTVEDPWQYIEDFENNMLYGHVYAKAGMSGGGVFDARGHYLGMVTGGTQHNEVAAVPLSSVVRAYEEVMEKEGQDGTGR